MAQNPETAPAWRLRWAARENDQRQRTYRAAAEAWHQRSNDLAGMRVAAVGLRGVAQLAPEVPIDLRRRETVYLTLSNAQMIEAPQAASLPPVGVDLTATPSEELGRPLPDGFRVMDAGMVVITSQRVAFLGAKGKREWAYAKMAGLLHDPSSPFTLMHVVNRQRISGLYLPSASAPGFRFNLTLAIADAREQRQAVIAQLDGLLAAHHRAQPVLPALAVPADAPATARVPGGKVSIGLVLLLALCTFAGVLTDPPGTSPNVVDSTRTVAPADAFAPNDVAAETPRSASTPSSSPSASPTEKPSSMANPSPTQAAVKPAPTKNSTPRPKRTTASPAPKKVNLCGAPQNPYGYNFCGGSFIYSPASDVCSYFSCINYFDKGVGYMIQCNDGMYSMSGGRPGSCSSHDGKRRAVYK